jgi:hypothetical protein
LGPSVSLTENDQFRSDIAARFTGEKPYDILTVDFNNPAGGLGHYWIKTKVKLKCDSSGAGWHAVGTATISDRWDFDWTWSGLADEWGNKYDLWTNSNGIGTHLDLEGRETRTALGSLISGTPFDITSVEIEIEQRNTDPFVKFKY